IWIALFACFIPGDALAGGGSEETKQEVIAAQEFIESPAAELFQSGDYERALIALEPLLAQYPGDPLLLRYKAMALDRTGESQKAIEIYRQILERERGHVPTRYFLAEAYARTGQTEKAMEEWRSIALGSEIEPYRQWSRQNVSMFRVPYKPEKPPVKRWSAAGKLSYEYDSNVILMPEEKNLRYSDDAAANRYTVNGLLQYRALSTQNSVIDMQGVVRQSLNDNSLDEFNFTDLEFGLSGRRRVKIFNRNVILGAEYGLLAGFLDGSFFSLRNRFEASADSRLTLHTRSVLNYRFTVAEFGPDGFTPNETSRDGLYQDVGLMQYWYTKDFRSYLFGLVEYNNAATRGGNFDLNGLTARVGIHTPMPFVKKTDADVSGGFLFGAYPHFTSLSSLDTNRREDHDWDLYAALTYHVTPQIGIRGFYRFFNSLNENGFFEYVRHIGGVQVLFNF
ncbi:MAG: tetratricopeptide repeat protein, partial [Candidatus Omnitrophica bacterium]|nr:tetratricopeptide repeat protein [Candidatus Omnitrophota bacterium]